MYTSLTQIRMTDNESVTDYLISVENIITALRFHTLNDIKKFKNFDCSFQPETYSVELADGTLLQKQCNGTMKINCSVWLQLTIIFDNRLVGQFFFRLIRLNKTILFY